MLIHSSLALYSWISLRAYGYCFLGLLDFLACSSSSHPLQTGFLTVLLYPFLFLVLYSVEFSFMCPDSAVTYTMMISKFQAPSPEFQTRTINSLPDSIYLSQRSLKLIHSFLFLISIPYVILFQGPWMK